MAHKMGLVCIPMITQSDVTKDRYYLSGETDYNWITGTTSVTSSSSYSGNIPYMPDNKHYFVAKPGSTSFATTSSQTGFSSTLTSVDNSWSSGIITVAGGIVSNVSISMSTFAYITNNSYTIAIGDVLYQDGALSHYGNSVYTDHTPIAVVFSLLSVDASWTHGYAVAYQNSSNSSAWGPTNTNPTGSTLVGVTALVNDKAGYTKTQAIKTSTYPAAYSAYNYVVRNLEGEDANPTFGTGKKQTSRWFLPSSGQWFEIIKNLGKMNLGYTNVYGENTYICWETTNSAMVTTTANTINTYFAPIKNAGYSVDIISTTTNFSDGFWTSTETARIVYNAYRVTFSTNYFKETYKGYMAIQYNNDTGTASQNKSEALMVRPIIAF